MLEVAPHMAWFVLICRIPSIEHSGELQHLGYGSTHPIPFQTSYDSPEFDGKGQSLCRGPCCCRQS